MKCHKHIYIYEKKNGGNIVTDYRLTLIHKSQMTIRIVHLQISVFDGTILL